MIFSKISRGALSAACALLLMTTFAYAEDIASEESGQTGSVMRNVNGVNLPKHIKQMQIGNKNITMADYYGDGAMMIELPSSNVRAEKTPFHEAARNLIRPKDEPKSYVIKQNGSTIMIRSGD
jgi:hypothetical protein